MQPNEEDYELRDVEFNPVYCWEGIEDVEDEDELEDIEISKSNNNEETLEFRV